MSLLTHSVLTVYPMDTIELSKDEDGLPIYDRPYNAADLRGVISRMVTDGVFPDYLDEMRPVSRGGSWYVTSGGAVANGLYIPLDEEVKVADQADIPSGQYLYIVCAARFDINNRDGAIFGRLSSNSSETPVRPDYVWLVDAKTTPVIGAIKAAEVDKIYPAAITYPANDLYPGGSMQWVDHTIAADLVQQ